MKNSEIVISAIQKLCKQNRCFSLKIDNKIITPKGELIEVPSSACRVYRQHPKIHPLVKRSDAWRVSILNAKGERVWHYVSDKQHGDWEKGLREVLRLLKKQEVVLRSGNRYITKEKANKKIFLDQPGICLSSSPDKKSGSSIDRFSISVKNIKTSVYIGICGKYTQQHWEDKLILAVRRRDDLTRQVNEKETFKKVF